MIVVEHNDRSYEISEKDYKLFVELMEEYQDRDQFERALEDNGIDYYLEFE